MSIVVDRPPGEHALETPPTVPRTQRQWWRWLFPWVKTAVSAPLDDEPLLVVNATDAAWALALGYPDLGVLPPRDRYAFAVVKRGVLSARQPQAPPGTPYLTLPLTPAIGIVMIDTDTRYGDTLYRLHAVAPLHGSGRPTATTR